MQKQNKSLKELDPKFIKHNIRAIVFDLDGVIIPVGTLIRENLDGTKLTVKTKKISPQMIKSIKQLKKHFWIIFASGRSLVYLQHTLEDLLCDKVSLIAENGNFVLINGRIEQLAKYDSKYFKKIINIRKQIKNLKQKSKKIYGFEPKQMIISVHAAEKMIEIEKIVKRNDIDNKLNCRWSGEAYDIGSKKINKQTALRYVCHKLKIKPKQVLTTGNALNDKEMLDFGIGITVDAQQINAEYAIAKKKGMLGGQVLAEYLLQIMQK